MHELESELQHIHYNNQLELQDLRSEAADAQQQLSVMHVQLEEAHEALRLARQGIEERDFLIATHERSEEALADHAVSVSGELQHAATDITALFVTVAAAEKQHRINSKAIRSLRDAVDRRADVLVANATQMVQAQQKGVEVAVDQLQALERGHTEQLSVVKEQLNKLKRVLGKVLEAGKEDVWALQERLAKVWWTLLHFSVYLFYTTPAHHQTIRVPRMCVICTVAMWQRYRQPPVQPQPHCRRRKHNWKHAYSSSSNT